MKRTSKSWLFFCLQLVFMLVAPCIFVWVQYGELTEKYKISVTALLLLLMIFLIFKKIILNKYLKSLDGKILNIETNSLSITDKTAIDTNKKAWRTLSIVQLLFNTIVPLILLVLAVITIKTVEDGLIKLYGCLMFCAISIFVGVIFKIAEIYSMRLPHEE